MYGQEKGTRKLHIVQYHVRATKKVIIIYTRYILQINIHKNKKTVLPTNSYTSWVYSQPNDNREKH